MQSFSNDELRALLTAAKAKSESDWLLLLLSFSHGLRVSEALALKRKDVENGYITVARLKGSLRTTQPLISHADPLFDEATGVRRFVRNLAGDQPLFKIKRLTVWRRMRRYGAAAGIPVHKCHPHALKHSAAMRAIRAGVENCRQYLGHKSLDSTGAYLRVSDQQASEAVGPAFRSV